jgi:endoglucanase
MYHSFRVQTSRVGLLFALGVSGYGCDTPSAVTNDAALTEQTCRVEPSRTLAPDTHFFAPEWSDGAKKQVKSLLKARQVQDARTIEKLESVPHAVWFTDGTPAEVELAVRKTMHKAALARRVPVLVAYNLPYRDCSQYSAGGAPDTVAYKAWISAFARGIGNGKAVVIVEPDGLGIIPNNTTIYGAEEWCKPTVMNADGIAVPAPEADPASRYAQLNFAVDTITEHAPSAAVYLDGSHAAWLGVGEAAYRLYTAGVKRAQGFFLNVSNYQRSDQSVIYGTWVSDCITAATAGAAWAAGHFDWCPSQYDPATNFATTNYTPEFAANVTASLASMMDGASATTHFVIDSSRNGRGPLDVSKYASPPYNQPESAVASISAGSWCNPPGAGVGIQPTAHTGAPLVDAYLWIKVPGESDGSCDIAGGARAWDFEVYNPWKLPVEQQTHFDPLWGLVDPAAGAWFPAQALELAKLANPAL